MNEEDFKTFANRFAAKILKSSKWFTGMDVMQIFDAELKKLHKEKISKNQIEIKF